MIVVQTRARPQEAAVSLPVPLPLRRRCCSVPASGYGERKHKPKSCHPFYWLPSPVPYWACVNHAKNHRISTAGRDLQGSLTPASEGYTTRHFKISKPSLQWPGKIRIETSYGAFVCCPSMLRSTVFLLTWAPILLYVPIDWFQCDLGF